MPKEMSEATFQARTAFLEWQAAYLKMRMTFELARMDLGSLETDLMKFGELANTEFAKRSETTI